MPGMPDRRMVFITMAGTTVLASLVLMVWHERGVGTVKTGVDPEHVGKSAGPKKSMAGGVENLLATGGGEEHSVAVERAQRLVKGDDPSPGTEDDLRAFVSGEKPDGLSSGEWQERVNVILNTLRGQVASTGDCARELTQVLLDMAGANPDPVIRTYAMQHLSLWYPRIQDEQDRFLVLELYRQMLNTPGEREAGAALQSLADLSLDQAGCPVMKEFLTRVDLDAAESRMLEDRNVPVAVRISAMQAGESRKAPGVLDSARRIASDPSENGLLRKSAIHCIGEFGSYGDIGLLDLLPRSDGNLSRAVVPALERLAKRHPQASALDRNGGMRSSF
jgi:hypothetical protein